MARRRQAGRERADILPTDNEALARALLQATERVPTFSSPSERAEAQPRDDAERLNLRAELLESPDADPAGFERIIGESDLTSINYLDRGRRAAAAVCRIRAPSLGGEWYGTGFLAGPRLLVTNHHVLADAGDAGQARLEFGYEHDVDGILKVPDSFNLLPGEIFYTDPALDVTFVAVAALSESGVPLERYGQLPLLPVSGKGVDKEWVTIIQHPNGAPKQIAIRSSQLVVLPPGAVPGVNLEHFIHYLTDTEPGSSGSPVVNDQWQVVALHHKAVPAPRDPKTPDAPTVWIGNEGVRISAIYRTLERCRLTDPAARAVLARLERGLGLPAPAPIEISSGPADIESDGKPFKASRWKASRDIGYDPTFLGMPIELKDIYEPARANGLVAPLLDGSGFELAYNHFSVVVHEDRKFALLTAVNLDGTRFHHPGDRTTVWRRDERMAEVYQPAGNFYEKKLGNDKIQFSRGHLVRRFDPAWGDDVAQAKLGDGDTFHYANAAPQFQKYNDTDWGNLEDYVLDRAQTTSRRITVFQGPIFRPDDPLYGHDREGGPWRIPLSYWKIAVVRKDDSDIAAAAFMNGQVQYVQALYEAKVFSGLTPYTLDQLGSLKVQTTVRAVEEATGLDFSAIRPFDAHGALESTRRTRWLNDPRDIFI